MALFVPDIILLRGREAFDNFQSSNGDHTWSSGANWSEGHDPDTGENVSVMGSFGDTLTFNVSTASVGNLFMGTPNGQYNSGATWVINDSGATSAQTLNVTGTLTLAPTPSLGQSASISFTQTALDTHKDIDIGSGGSINVATGTMSGGALNVDSGGSFIGGNIMANPTEIDNTGGTIELNGGTLSTDSIDTSGSTIVTNDH
jgi:hypothetical protein